MNETNRAYKINIKANVKMLRRTPAKVLATTITFSEKS